MKQIFLEDKLIIKKWIWVWDFDREELWLNSMAAQGYALRRVRFCKYEFEKTEPGEYTVRLEMKAHDEDYLDFMREAKIEYIGRVFQWQYFRKAIADGEFEIFSNTESRLEHLGKIARLLSALAIINLGIGITYSVLPPHAGFINLICSVILAYSLGRIHEKIAKLQWENMYNNQ